MAHLADVENSNSILISSTKTRFQCELAYFSRMGNKQEPSSECTKNVCTSSQLSEEDIERISQRNKERWRHVLSVFDPVKGLPDRARSRNSSIAGSRSKCSSRRTVGPNPLKPCFVNNKTLPTFGPLKPRNSTAESDITKMVSKPASIKNTRPYPKEVHVSTPLYRSLSFNARNGRNVKNTFKNKSESFATEDDDELQIVCDSSSDESDVINQSHRSLNDKEDYSIVSCSSGSDDDFEKNTSKISAKQFSDPKNDLDLFIRAIKSDLRRTNKLKEKFQIKQNSYLEKFKTVIGKSNMDLGFLDYEQRAGILKGTIETVTKVEKSYGVCFAFVQSQIYSNCCYILDKEVESVKAESKLVSFVETSNVYIVKNQYIFIQSNKVISS